MNKVEIQERKDMLESDLIFILKESRREPGLEIKKIALAIATALRKGEVKILIKELEL